MPKCKLEIDVPEGWELAGYRVPLEGEYYLNDGEAMEAMADFVDDRIVLAPGWRWPIWLKASYIAMNADGEWWAFRDEMPTIDDVFWISTGFEACLDPDTFRFDAPRCDDWRKSLIENPAYIRGNK